MDKHRLEIEGVVLSINHHNEFAMKVPSGWYGNKLTQFKEAYRPEISKFKRKEKLRHPKTPALKKKSDWRGELITADKLRTS